MIQTITRREYTVACDGCGITGPAAGSAPDACRQVHELGWQSLSPIPRFDFLTTWLCPVCQEHREAAASAAV
jgi:hypothetical protein